MKKENVNVGLNVNLNKHLSLEGEGGTQCRVRGKVKQGNFISTPSSALRASSHSRGKGGFTLIELLVVVLIIGILAAIAMPQYTKAVEKSRLSEMQQMVATLEKAADIAILSSGFPSTEERIDYIPLTDIDYGDSFSYNEDRHAYCNSAKICISSQWEGNTSPKQWLICVESRRKSGFQSAPDYYLCSEKQNSNESWSRSYHSCDTNIDSFGLETFGYSSASC